MFIHPVYYIIHVLPPRLEHVLYLETTRKNKLARILSSKSKFGPAQLVDVKLYTGMSRSCEAKNLMGSSDFYESSTVVRQQILRHQVGSTKQVHDEIMRRKTCKVTGIS